MCTICDSTNINTIIEFVPNCLKYVSGDGFSGGSDSYLQFRHTHAPCLLKLCIPPSNGIVRWWLFPEYGAELPLDYCTPIIILNNPLYDSFVPSNWTLGTGGWSTPCPDRFNHGKDTRYQFYRSLVASQGRSRWLGIISPPPGLDPQTFHPVSLCTDRVIAVHTQKTN